MIFFDIDDTLIDHRHAQEQAALAFYREFEPYIRCEEDDFPAVWRYATFNHFAAFARGQCSFEEQQRRRVRDVLRDRELTDAEADDAFAFYLRHYENNWVLFPDVLPALESLEHSGLPLAVLVNGDPTLQRKKLARFDLAKYFRAIFVAEKGSACKPSNAIFALAAAQVEVKAEACLYVGDDLKNDAIAAVAAGWRGIWLDRTGIMQPMGEIEVITSLREVSLIAELPRRRDWPEQPLAPGTAFDG